MKFMQIKPQKARGKLLESMWTDPEWVAEEKYDGDRRIAQFCGNMIRFTGTRESVDGTGYVEKSANIRHLSDYLFKGYKSRGLRELDGTVLDGEIVAPFAKNLPGGKSKYVTSIMGSDPERAIMLQKQHGWLEYMVFDCLWYLGDDVRDLTLGTRRGKAAQALVEWGNKHAKIVPQFGGAENYKQEYFKRILREGGEGVILKNLNHTYGNEKLWVKVKGEWTADVVIGGFDTGKGKYAGQVGAIIFGQYKDGKLTTLGSARGFTDELMRKLTAQPKKYIGQVIELIHNGREPTGAFRHPRFKRFRPDKSPKDCVYREDET